MAKHLFRMHSSGAIYRALCALADVEVSPLLEMEDCDENYDQDMQGNYKGVIF